MRGPTEKVPTSSGVFVLVRGYVYEGKDNRWSGTEVDGRV